MITLKIIEIFSSAKYVVNFVQLSRLIEHVSQTGLDAYDVEIMGYTEHHINPLFEIYKTNQTEKQLADMEFHTKFRTPCIVVDHTMKDLITFMPDNLNPLTLVKNGDLARKIYAEDINYRSVWNPRAK